MASDRLSNGIIILISIAIALGVVLLVVLVGVILAISRASDEANYPPTGPSVTPLPIVKQRRPVSHLAVVGAASVSIVTTQGI